ncbi:MAG: virulence-associated E family protein [Oscillospiraceae bacterium]|nr:virulence-associated E family protein [Oscillospiraceae bacterium]
MLKTNLDEVRRTLEIFKPDNGLIEIRSFKRKYPTSGYFKDDYTKLLNGLMRLDYTQCYFILNSIKLNCYSREQHDEYISGAESTTDNDIEYREWLLIDADPKRESGISSTDAEKEAAKKTIFGVCKYLTENGFPKPVYADSGNGYHLLYRINMPNDETSKKLLQKFLHTLSVKFSDGYVKIDESVFNAARITKLYGTVARKGADLPERPHRLSRILAVPDEIQTTDAAMIGKIYEVPATNKKENSHSEKKYNKNKFNIDEFLSKYLNVVKTKQNGEWINYILDECPFNPSHKSPDSMVSVHRDGAIVFKCLHDSCSDKKWEDVREIFEPRQTKKDTFDKSTHADDYSIHINGTAPDKPAYADYIRNADGKIIKSFDNFKIMLDSCGIKIKNNSVKGIEFSGNLPEMSEENIDNIIGTYLYSVSMETGIKFTLNEIGNYIIMAADQNYYNPIKDWLNTLDTTKHGTVRKYFDCLIFDENEKENIGWYYMLFQKWLIQCVALQFNTLQNPIKPEGALGLQSWSEGIGKTTFFEKLVFDPKLFKDSLSLDPAKTDSIRIITSYWIGELGEVETTLKRDFPRLKGHITEMSDVYRVPYARNPIAKPRRTSYCFTCNPNEFLPDGENRRFWTIPVSKISRALNEISITDLWGEIYAYYLENPLSYKLTPEEIQFLAENNRDKFSKKSNEEIVLRDKLNFERDGQYWSYMTATEISMKLFGNIGVARNIGYVMAQKIGYIKGEPTEEFKKVFKIYDGVKKYYVPLQAAEIHLNY